MLDSTESSGVFHPAKSVRAQVSVGTVRNQLVYFILKFSECTGMCRDSTEFPGVFHPAKSVNAQVSVGTVRNQLVYFILQI